MLAVSSRSDRHALRNPHRRLDTLLRPKKCPRPW
jgi:hypothetical protein